MSGENFNSVEDRGPIIRIVKLFLTEPLSMIFIVLTLMLGWMAICTLLDRVINFARA
ncbi:MAG: hypothetical protein PHI56_00575 [Victivallaceae bacterium]|jgi:hypothetical protein|nr:hypothetical protein [Victivallaceae bacterium]MDD3117218.1 hypothetical protein [Victivallaceae bacterium]MDD3702679.1 hypothetical protein [Victivallaceae bacterium]